MTARAPKIHGTCEPWATLAWALVGVACAPLAMWIVKAVCMAALSTMDGAS